MKVDGRNFMRGFTLQIACCAALAACDGGSGSNANPPPTGPTGPVATQIQAMEDQGKLPKLDRSTEIKGPDVNNDGVRDDVAAYIDTLPIDKDQKAGLIRDSRAIQQAILTDVGDKAALQLSVDVLTKEVGCAHDSFKGDTKLRQVYMVKAKAATLNTRERSRQWAAWNQATSGMPSPTLEPGEDQCAR